MKKIYSLLKATMTNNMSLFKIKTKNNNKLSKKLIPLFISTYLMFMIWTSANTLFEKTKPMHLQTILLTFFIFLICIMTIIEGIYKSGSLIFNCKDDDLLLSLPIKRKTILFIRIFKFYLFELIFNSLFLLPILIAYIKWADSLNWTYFLTNIIMLFILPIIPIIISCIIGFFITSLSSRFKYKNATQIIISMLILISVLYLSYNTDNLIKYIIKNSTNINNLITKIYYPIEIYNKLITNFNIIDLITFIVINIIILIISISILNKFYFKINSRLKKTINNQKSHNNILNIKKSSPIKSLIKKELNTFFKTPVFVINTSFALVLFIIATITITINFNSIIPILTNQNIINLPKNLIMENLSIIVFILISSAACMTSITNSTISLEGKNINILKSLPINTKTILISKILFGLTITTPILLIGNIMLLIKFKINVIDSLLLLLLSILLPLTSHFTGVIINLKYPKLDAENSTEIVKQSASSLISVTIGIIQLFIIIIIITKLIGLINKTIILIIFTIIHIIINTILYLYLTKKSIKDFENLSI